MLLHWHWVKPRSAWPKQHTADGELCSNFLVGPVKIYDISIVINLFKYHDSTADVQWNAMVFSDWLIKIWISAKQYVH